MTMIFEESNIRAKAIFGNVMLGIDDPNKGVKVEVGPIAIASKIATGMPNKDTIVVNYNDFCSLVHYVMTNEDLVQDDIRLKFLEIISKYKLVEGWNPRNKRIVFETD